MFLYATALGGDRILDKLQEWIKKAFAVLVQIARNLMSHGKISVSVGVVGIVLSVDVTAEVSGGASTTNPWSRHSSAPKRRIVGAALLRHVGDAITRHERPGVSDGCP